MEITQEEKETGKEFWRKIMNHKCSAKTLEFLNREKKRVYEEIENLYKNRIAKY